MNKPMIMWAAVLLIIFMGVNITEASPVMGAGGTCNFPMPGAGGLGNFTASGAGGLNNRAPVIRYIDISAQGRNSYYNYHNLYETGFQPAVVMTESRNMGMFVGVDRAVAGNEPTDRTWEKRREVREPRIYECRGEAVPGKDFVFIKYDRDGQSRVVRVDINSTTDIRDNITIRRGDRLTVKYSIENGNWIAKSIEKH